MADDPIDQHIGEQLRRLRERRHMTLQAIADPLGLSYQQVAKYESGKNRVSAATLFHLSEILGVPPAAFFEGLNKPCPMEAPALQPNLSDGLERIRDEKVRQKLSELILALKK